MTTRRRFISIIAGCLALPSAAAAGDIWRGRAMGAEAQIILSAGTGTSTYRVFGEIERIIAAVEHQFSLHVDSELQRLNETGLLRHPSRQMLDVFRLADAVHLASSGAFDPTIQPLWLALAQGGDVAAARRLVDWQRVSCTDDALSLPAGFQLTFNGMAQGYCADQVASHLRRRGFAHVLVDTGEILAIGPQPDGSPWPVMIADPRGRVLARTAVTDRAIATSSPFATKLPGGAPHILSPRGRPPRWSTVSISAPTAALADGLSTAACLLDRDELAAMLKTFPDARLEALA